MSQDPNDCETQLETQRAEHADETFQREQEHAQELKTQFESSNVAYDQMIGILRDRIKNSHEKSNRALAERDEIITNLESELEQKVATHKQTLKELVARNNVNAEQMKATLNSSLDECKAALKQCGEVSARMEQEARSSRSSSHSNKRRGTADTKIIESGLNSSLEALEICSNASESMKQEVITLRANLLSESERLVDHFRSIQSRRSEQHKLDLKTCNEASENMKQDVEALRKILAEKEDIVNKMKSDLNTCRQEVHEGGCTLL